MKKTFLLLASAFFCLNIFSQTYNSPESIEFDYANNRWLIANNGGNNILARNSGNGVLTTFATGFSSGPHGLEIVNDTVYACDGGSLKAYNLNTGTLVFNKSLGASFLNGITHDNNGNLFITDYSGNKIYRFTIASRQFNVFVSSGISSPNGIIFDQPNNRCVFVQWTGAIKSVLLSDSTVSTIIASSGLSSIDGITKDGAGNYYLSSWGLNGISKYNNTFTVGPTTVVTGLNKPADIFYNTLTDTLGVPNSGTTGTSMFTNKASFHYFGSATGIVEQGQKNNLNISVSPNPVIKAAEINYVLSENCKVTIQLFDTKGSLVKTIANEEQGKGGQTTFFSKGNLAGGQYILKIETEKYRETKNIIIAE